MSPAVAGRFFPTESPVGSPESFIHSFNREEVVSHQTVFHWGFPSGTSGKEPPASAGDARELGSIPGSGRSPGGGHGNPLQYSCLENPMGRGAWRATVTPSPSAGCPLGPVGPGLWVPVLHRGPVHEVPVGSGWGGAVEKASYRGCLRCSPLLRSTQTSLSTSMGRAY